MKRLLTVSLIVLFCLSSVFAGGSGETTGADNEIRVVTYFAGSDQWAPVWKEVIADYQAAHPEVRILDESQPTAGANDLFRTKIRHGRTDGFMCLLGCGLVFEKIRFRRYELWSVCSGNVISYHKTEYNKVKYFYIFCKMKMRTAAMAEIL